MKLLFIALSLLSMFGNVHADELLTAQMSLTSLKNKALADQTLLMSQADETTGDQSLFNDDDTYFNQVGEMFAQGTLPSAREVVGWWSGRCYRQDSPDEPTAALFVFEYNNSRHGPIFPRNVKMLFLVPTNSTSPDYFDNLTDHDKVSVRKVIRDHNDPVRVGNNSWITRSNGLEFWLRKHQGFFIVPYMIFADDDRAVVKNCYFFKKVYSY